MSSSARRALKILAAVGCSSRPMGVTEIARAIGTSPGTAFRGLDALQSANLIARHPASQRYGLGPATLGLRQSLLTLFRIRTVCLPYLRQLASASGETSSLLVRIGWHAARIAAAPGIGEVTTAANVSGVHPLGADIAGRAILAHLGRDATASYRAWTAARGIVSTRALEDELSAIRDRGFALRPASQDGGIAFPIRKSDQAFAAIAIDGLGAQRASFVAECRETARAVEALVRANPELAHQPFEHIAPDEVDLPS